MDPALAVYVDDIAKSFLGDASDQDSNVLMPIVRDITYRQVPGIAPSLTSRTASTICAIS
jgi:hypothetical protein